MKKNLTAMSIRSNKYRRTSVKGRNHLIAVLFFLAFTSVTSLHFANERMQDQVYASYCGDFGFYDKSLTLMKGGTFNFNYTGCSQSMGRTTGVWELKDDYLFLENKDDVLESKYLVKKDSLSAANKDGFILCEYYVEPFARGFDF